MYAIVEIAGKQYKVEKGKKIYVDLLDGKAGDKVSFDNVLLVDNGKAVTVGTPTTGTKVEGKIVEHKKADKVIVFKKKRRKGYKTKNGHRQQYTQVEISKI